MSLRPSRPYLHSPKILVAAVLAAAVWVSPAWTQTAATMPSLILPGTPATAPATAPAEVPMVRILPGTMTTPTPATAPAAGAATLPTVAAVTQPFVGAITGDKVYIRSGPDQKNYEIGQLVKGDLVYVVGQNKGWYQILPPNGAFCMLDKQYVALDAGGATGTLTGDYVNVHAGSASYKADPYAILPPSLRKGTKVKVLGSTDKYYEIAPPEKAYFYVSAMYVGKAAPGTDYKVAQLKLPAGVTGPSGITVEAPTTLPTAVVSVPVVVVPTATLPATNPAGGGTTVAGGGAAPPPLPPVEPRVTFSETATAKFRDVNARYQAEAKKPVADQKVEGLLKEFQDLLTLENLSPSVKAGTQATIAAIERTITVQRLIVEQAAANDATKQQTDALREQFAAAERAIAAAREAGPYAAEGVLQTSTVVTGKYALVNPQTARVVAYVDPATASVDIGSLVGKYIGVRGMSKRMENSDIMVIQVNNATLMPQPK